MVTRTDLPTGTVTFLFTDIEGSTRLLESIGEGAHALFDRHAAIVRSVIVREGGVVVNTDGDAFFCVFETPTSAVTAAAGIQRDLSGVHWPSGAVLKVRIGLHTGLATLGGTDYQGIDVHRAARVADAGHGGQVVLSRSTAEAIAGVELAGVEVRDLGVHRLKDLVEPERLSDLVVDGLEHDFPPLRTVATHAGGLPQLLDEFVGRDREISDIVDLLQQHRLVTCTGPGGVGKTRLAVAAAAAAATAHDRVVFVPLAGLDGPDAVAPAILRALGVAPSSEPAADRLPGALASGSTLVVLDNFEHVLDARGLAEKLLERTSEVTLLITSRAALRIRGEREYIVAPLSVGEGSEAVALFVARATEVRPDLVFGPEDTAAATEITQLLGGVPLAVELAAARTALMPPVALRARMSSVLDLGTAAAGEPRQRTLRGTIQWSYDLLTSGQQELLDASSVFRGGATLDSLEAVTRTESDSWQWIGDVEALVSNSLMIRAGSDGDARFELLEMIREFGAERLADARRTRRVERRHLDWFLDLALRANAGIRTRAQGAWLDTLDDERANLEVALATAMEHGDAQAAARLVHALWRFWHMRGPVPEGVIHVGKVLAMEGLDGTDRLLALEAAGGLAWWMGDMPSANRLYADALVLARREGSPEQLANALYNAGLTADFLEPGAGRELLGEGIEVASAADDTLGLAQCRWGMSVGLQFDHDLTGAHEQLCLALGGFEQVGDAFMRHWTTRELGTVEMELGRMEESRHHLRESLDFFAETGDRSGMILLLRDHARMAAIEGRTHRALLLLGATAAAESESGLQLGAFELEALGWENPLKIDDQGAADTVMAEGATWTLAKAVRYAREGG